ncbi:MAG TPA: hypothetical protein DCW29_17845 [Janthinobacterium sp.]|nr:hypothetical protein [Janthinobacterium sp.]
MFRQRGIALLMSIVMLLLMTLMALTAFKLGKSSLQIAGNQQQRSQGLTAAQGAIEQVISSTQFATTPANAVPAPCGGVPNTTCVDVDGDGVADVNVLVTPTCVSAQIIPVSALNYSDPNDAGCLAGVSQGGGIDGAANNNSMCANMIWDVQAVATDTTNNAQNIVHQGTAVRVAATTTCP